MNGFEFRRARLIAPVALLVLLGGCSSLPSMPSMSMPSWFTSSGSNANASAGPLTALPANFECPPVQVRTGAATLTSSANATEPTATNLRYQVTIGSTARECRMGAAPNTVTLKVGLQGRVILGPEGGGVTQIDVPVRFAVVRELIETKVISTKLDRVSVSIPPDNTNVLFSHVTEGLDFAIPRGGDLDSYIIYIGFDAGAAEPEQRRPAPKRPKAAQPRPPTG